MLQFTLVQWFRIAIWEETVTDDVPPSNSITSFSGGVNLDAERVNIGGDVVGRDKITNTTIFTGDQQYDVHGLANPYLGLQSFTYVDLRPR